MKFRRQAVLLAIMLMAIALPILAAPTSDTSTMVKVADAKSFEINGQMAKITIEESYTGEFQSQTDDKTIRVDIDEPEVIFNYNKDVEIPNALKGTKAYEGQNFDAKIIDSTTLEVTIPKKELKGQYRGGFTLSGIEMKAEKDASYGDVKVTVSGDLNPATQIRVARYRNYGVELGVAKETTGVAGKELRNVVFTLSETVADSLVENRETNFIFSDGVTIQEVQVSDSAGIQAGKAALPSIRVAYGKNTNEFTVQSIPVNKEEITSLTFKATLDVPISFTGDIDLIVEGESLENKQQVKIAKVIRPVEVQVTPAIVQTGLEDQDGGKILIKEKQKGMLSSGKIFLAMENTDVNYIEAPDVKVKQGNLTVDPKAKIVQGGIEIRVTGKSTQASTLEISGGKLKAHSRVANGIYKVKVGGPAISAYSNDRLWNNSNTEHYFIDEIAEEDYVYVGTQHIAPKVSFTIDESQYTVNGEVIKMDTASYLSKGRRTMVPVRYLSDALGVESDQIIWDSERETVTIIADSIIELKLGSREMLIDQSPSPMTTPAEMKDGRLFVPVAEIARALKAKVEWDPTTNTASFN